MSKRPFVATDLSRFVLTGEPQFSPDAREIVFVRQVSDLGDNKLYSTLWLMDADGNNLRPLTHGKLNDRQPRWSPDGQRIAFISGRSEQSKLWVLDRRGGEAWEIKTDVAVNSAPVWSPDGTQIAFSGRSFPHEHTWAPYPGAPADDFDRAKAQADKALSGKKDKGDPVSDVKVITRLRHKMDGIGYFGDLRSQIFVVDLPTEPGGQATSRQLTDGDFDHLNPVWSADGKELLFTAARSQESDWQLKQDLWKVNLVNGELVQVLDWTGFISSLRCSPDGKWLAFAGDDKRFGGSTSTDLWLVPNQIGQQSALARKLTGGLDRPVGNVPSSDVRFASSNQTLYWKNDGCIVFLYGNEGATCIGEVCLQSGEIRTVWHDAMRTVSAFDLSTDGKLAVQIGSPTRSDDLYLVQGSEERQLTDFNSVIYEECLVAPCQRLTYVGDQGWDIDGWLLTPPDWDGQTPLPTVLLIHGGPHGVYGSCFAFQAQIQASNGIAVFYANPRGSQSYGQDFAYAVVGDWGGADYRDLMLGIDHLIATGVADAERLGIMGWSYGGFMSSWTITQTNRFKAALPGAIVGNRHSFYGNSDIGYFFGEHQFGGTPWEDAQKLLERSAINSAHQVQTPVLFMHGESDLRCPVEQTEQFFTALRRQGKPAVMVRYPNEFHAVSQPRHKEDRYKRILAWFKYHLA